MCTSFPKNKRDKRDRLKGSATERRCDSATVRRNATRGRRGLSSGCGKGRRRFEYHTIEASNGWYRVVTGKTYPAPSGGGQYLAGAAIERYGNARIRQVTLSTGQYREKDPPPFSTMPPQSQRDSATARQPNE
jgi:hypothetical protein